MLRDLVEGDLLHAGEVVVVGVSGGADSISLLTVLRALGTRHRFPLEIHVAHLDHGLRGEDSDRDAAFVASCAQEWGLPSHQERADGLGSSSSSNLEARARDARARFFARIAEASGAQAVAVGHTLDDQAETVLHRLARGGGARSIAAMEMRREDGVIRPLLKRRRAECVQYLRDVGGTWVEDASNLDPRFTRNRIRHDVLPALSGELGVDMSERLALLAGDLRVESRLADLWIAEVLDRQSEGDLAVAAVVSAGAGAGRLVHSWLSRRGARPTRAQVGAVVRIARGGGPSDGTDLHGYRVERRYDRLRCGPAGAVHPAAREDRPWGTPGAVELESGWRLSAEALPAAAGSGTPPAEVVVDAARVEGALTVRTVRPGDRIRLRAGRRKLSDLFIDKRIPRAERSRLAVVTRGADIVWVPGVAIDSTVLPGPSTTRRMRLRAERINCRHLGSVLETQEFRVEFG